MSNHVHPSPSAPQQGFPTGPPAGLRVDGYELLHRLGEGGMGVVHLARRGDGPRVALKVLRPHIIGDAEARARLAQEVSSLSRIASLRVAEIVDSDPFGEIPYVATRYVPGYSLHQQIEMDGPLNAEDLTWFARCLADGLAAVHTVGVLHRDIKPTNILMEGRSPVLIDFGLARLAEDQRLTQPGWLLGTPGYLAPEILFGEDATAASDIHSWAAATIFAGTGRPPFGTGPAMAVMDRVRRGEYRLDPIAEPLASLLREALAPDPLDRPTLREVREWFDSDAPVTAVHRVLPAERADAPLLTQPFVVTPRDVDPLVAPAVGTGHGHGHGSQPEDDFLTAVLGDAATDAGWDDADHRDTHRFPLQTQVLGDGEEATVHLNHEGFEPGDEPAEGPIGVGRRVRRVLLNMVLALAVGALATMAPLMTLLALAAGVWLLRSGSLAGSSRDGRRSVRGAKWYDSVQVLAAAPWHLVKAVPGALLLLAWSGGIATATALLCFALNVGVGTGLFLTGAVFTVSLWLGPGGDRWASPLSRVTHTVVARPPVWALVCLVLVIGVGIAVVGSGPASSVNWAPLDRAPLQSLR